MGYLKLPIVTGGGGGGGTTDDITNLSGVTGTTLTQALDNVDSDITNITVTVADTQYKPNEPYTLTATDITNKYVILTSAPVTKEITQVFVIGGTIQNYGEDFIVTADDAGKRLSWNGYGLESVLSAGDIIVVIHN